MLLFSKKKNGQSVDRWHFSYICIMKRGFLFVCLWLYSFNFWGREVIGTYWKPIDNTFDSIADVLELEFISTDSIYYRDSLIQELYTIARAHHKETVYLWRAKFWDARSQLKKNNSDSTIHLIDEAYQQVDSIRYVYDYMRVFHLWTIMHKNQPHVAYKNLKKIYAYKIKDYWSNISTVDAYYQTNMDFLKADVRKHFFKTYPAIYSKVGDLPPAKYNPGAVVKNSLVASGSIINGTVENSVLFKKVYVGNNCVIKNSIILNDVYLGDNTYIENCIVESRDTIRANTRHIGENGVKVVVEKNERYAL